MRLARAFVAASCVLVAGGGIIIGGADAFAIAPAARSAASTTTPTTAALSPRPLPPAPSISFSSSSALRQSGRADAATEREASPQVAGDDGGNGGSGFSYGRFAQDNPLANNLLIATAKTAAADLLAQTVIAGTPLTEIDAQRVALFAFFGLFYLGGFQYLYQVQIFKRIFDVDKFTNQDWSEKLRDGPGLQSLAAQTALDMTVLTLVYLPTFYVFKAGVFSGSMDPSVWIGTGLENFGTNFVKDEWDLARVWIPADLVCFSVPLYLRLPVRHVVSFVWTAYLSFVRGGH